MMFAQIALWYGIFLFLGWMNYPLSCLLFPAWKSRGYAFSKVLALLELGFLFWITNLFGILNNTSLSVLASLLVIVVINLAIFLRKRDEVWVAIKENSKHFLVVEALFLIAFVSMALLRAMAPNLTGTEKPMELAFINSILTSPTFPPADPWLSGYAISYYYFGYLLVAMLARLSGVAGGVAFNLAISAWLGMACIAVYGIVFELLQHTFTRRGQQQWARRSVWLALLAPLLLLLGNGEGGLEVLHAQGVFWETDAEGIQSSSFWEWLDVQELKHPPLGEAGWTPRRVGGTWWWRASRVVSDYDAAGNFREVIDEFPAFSFHLADLHPHVLSIPFLLLAVAYCLNLYLQGENSLFNGGKALEMFKDWHIWMTALVFGALLFVNTWDFPAGFGLFALTAITLYIRNGTFQWQRFLNGMLKIVLLAILCILVYLPFFLGFDSQAGGIFPSLLYRTRGVHFAIMFFPFLLPLIVYLIWVNWKQKAPDRLVLRYLLLFLAAVGLLSLAFPVVHQLAIGFWMLVQDTLGGVEVRIQTAVQQAQEFAAIYAAEDICSLLTVTLGRRLRDSSVLIGLSLCLFLVLRFIFSIGTKVEAEDERKDEESSPIKIFVLLLILVGGGLCLIPEFFYLVDVFRTRMNTIFKFYFQAWILWSMAASYALVVLWKDLKGYYSVIFKIAAILMILISCIYPFYTTYERVRYTRPADWTLDGTAYLARYDAADQALIETLRQLPYGVLVEAVGGSYSGYARIATMSGYPNVLGWPGHELQWRGGAEEMGSRQSDIAMLYESTDWLVAKQILDQYAIEYVVVGRLEKSTYTVQIEKFYENLTTVSEHDGTTLFMYEGND